LSSSEHSKLHVYLCLWFVPSLLTCSSMLNVQKNRYIHLLVSSLYSSRYKYLGKAFACVVFSFTTHTYTFSLNHTLNSHEPARTHSHSLSLSFSSLSLSRSLARSPSLSHTCAHTAIKRSRTRSTDARQVNNAHEQDLVTNQNV